MQKGLQKHFDPFFFVKLVDWLTSLCHSSVPAVAAYNIACAVAGNMCVLGCLHPRNPALPHLSASVPDMNGRLPSAHRQRFVSGSSFPLSVGHIAPSSYNGDICSGDLPASSGNESALNRNIATILLSFQSFFIILLAPPIQEWPDKSAAQWAARWRRSSGVWMTLACVMFESAAVLFSAV